MLPLFKIEKPIIDYKAFNHNLHGSIVNEFEDAFASYMGVKYAIAVNSCTSAIFLVCKWHKQKHNSVMNCRIPTMIPNVVLNSLIHAKAEFKFIDDAFWVGNEYFIMKNPVFSIVDSAQGVNKNKIRLFVCKSFDDNVVQQPKKRGKSKLTQEERWCALYSFYPTKPIAGIDGGMIVTNNKELNDWLRIAIMNGTTIDTDSWRRKPVFPGWKFYMSSAQAYVAFEQFKKIDEKKIFLRKLRDFYDKNLHALGNVSDHLYRILVENNLEFIELMKKEKIQCGVHYHCMHLEEPYKRYFHTHKRDPRSFSLSKEAAAHTVSIPYHLGVGEEERNYIVKQIKKYEKL